MTADLEVPPTCLTETVKVFQSKYFFQLKYDPFNGGQMVEKLAINILKNPLFSDL